MKKEKLRYIILVQLFISAFCSGGTYAWSVLSRGLQDFHGWSISDVTFGYSLMCIVLAFIGIFSGRFLDKFGPKYLMLFAGLLFGGGWFLVSQATTLWQFWLYFGLISGAGDGLLYNTVITTAIRWFPEKRGLISGIMVGSAGLAPLVISPLADYLVSSYSVNGAFKFFGAVFFIVVASGVFIAKNPPLNWKPEGYLEPVTTGRVIKSSKEIGPGGMMKDIKFYLLWLAFFAGCNSGLLLISNGAQLGIDLAGLTSAVAASFVGILAVFNFVGRMGVGALGDKIGRIKCLYIVFITTAVLMLFFGKANTYLTYLIISGLIGVCFGGLMANFPVITGEVFGVKYQGSNYGIMFTAYGIAAFTGPMVGAWFRETTGSWNGAFIFAACLAIVSLVLIHFVRVNLEKTSKSEAASA